MAATEDNIPMTLEDAEKAKWDPNNADPHPTYQYDDEAAEADPTSQEGFIPTEPDEAITSVDDALKAVDAKLAREKEAAKKQSKIADEAEKEPDDKDETPEEESAASADETPAVDEDLVRSAREAGLSKEDIAEFTEAQLRKALVLYDRSILKQQEEEAEEGDGDEAAPEAPAAEFDPKEYGLDPEFADPATIEAFKKLHDTNQAQAKRMTQEVGHLQGQIREQARNAFQARFDGWIAALAPEYRELLGEGPTSELHEDSAEFMLRDEVANTANSVATGLNERKQGMPAETELLNRGLYAALGNKITEIEQKRAERQAKTRKGRTTAVPSARKTQDDRKRKGTSAAKDWVNQFVKDEGLHEAFVDGIDAPYVDGI